MHFNIGNYEGVAFIFLLLMMLLGNRSGVNSIFLLMYFEYEIASVKN